jgi:hypothetical protein
MKKKEYIDILIIKLRESLSSKDFKYISSKQCFIQENDKIAYYIHLNFGLDIINASFGLKFKILENDLPDELRA